MGLLLWSNPSIAVFGIYQLLLLVGGRDLLLQPVQEALNSRHSPVQVAELQKGKHEALVDIFPQTWRIQEKLGTLSESSQWMPTSHQIYNF